MKFVSVADLKGLIGDIGLERTLLDLAGYLEADFARWESFEKAPRLASHSESGVIELMPASDAERFAFKYVNGHPGNAARGLQTVAAFGVLANVATGYPLLIAEMTIATALRTGATCALAAQRLARPNARTMALIGLGAQSEFQAYAFRALTGVRRIKAFDIDPAAMRKFLANMGAADLEVVPCASVQEAVAGADIVTTVTADKRRSVVLGDNDIGAGVHINAVGGDCPGKTELHPRILQRASVFVEFEPQTRIEGEIQQMAPDFPVTELWRVLSGAAPGRRSAQEVTVFDSVGFALEDFSALRYIHDRALAAGRFSVLDLIAAPLDPKDLFGLIAAGTGAAGGDHDSRSTARAAA